MPGPGLLPLGTQPLHSYKRPRPPAELQASSDLVAHLGDSACSRVLPVLKSCKKYCCFEHLSLGVVGCAHACLVTQSCPTLCNSMNCSSPVATWTATCPEAHGQAPLSMEFSQARILEWVAISFFGDLLNPGIEPMCRALAGKFFTTEPLGKPWVICYVAINTCNLGHGDSGKEDLAGLCR